MARGFIDRAVFGFRGRRVTNFGPRGFNGLSHRQHLSGKTDTENGARKSEHRFDPPPICQYTQGGIFTRKVRRMIFFPIHKLPKLLVIPLHTVYPKEEGCSSR